MQSKSYPSRWLITYQGKPYMSVYGKKKAYDLYVRLSRCVNGLHVEAAPKRRTDRSHKDKREYHREWRANNKEKIREYNRRSYLKRKQKIMLEQIRQTGAVPAAEAGQLEHEAYHRYLRWLQADLPERMKAALHRMSVEMIADHFGRQLTLSEGGVTAETGVGTNRLNTYTVRRLTQALASYLKKLEKKTGQGSRVVIAYDTRQHSREFALESAQVLALAGIRCCWFAEPCPSPILSYAVRKLQADAGIMITGGRLPVSYSGYRIYGPEGARIAEQAAEAIRVELEKVRDELSVEALTREEMRQSGRCSELDRVIYEDYYAHLMTKRLYREGIPHGGEGIKIVYTPLHGTGAEPVCEVLRRAGFTQVQLVPEQARADGAFPTVEVPDPLDQTAVEHALKLAWQVQADLILATDPEGCGVGVSVRKADGQYMKLSGHALGALLLNGLLAGKHRIDRLSESGVIFKSVLASELGRAIADAYGVETVEILNGTPLGDPLIGERSAKCHQSGEYPFMFAYEADGGYLIDDWVRERDGMLTSLLILETAAYYRERGMTLAEALEQLHERFGFYEESEYSIHFAGREGAAIMEEMMNGLREYRLPKIEGWQVNWIRDFERGTDYHLSSNMLRATGLPRANLICYSFDNGAWFAVQPSGIRLKICFGTAGSTKEEAMSRMMKIRSGVFQFIDQILEQHCPDLLLAR